MNLNWIKCQNGIWCDFLKVNLEHKHFNDLKGVYIIWSNKTTVRLGSGEIKERIAEHRNNVEITKYSNLKITWVQIHANQMEGVEKYLAEILDPIVGERFPDRTPIEVNLPW